MISILKSKVIAATALLLMLIAGFYSSQGQILVYGNTASGALSSVAANATGTALAYVNGAVVPGAPCSTGFSAMHFTTATTYVNTMPAIEVSATPNSGYSLNVTGFKADLRRSASGPAAVRFAYSTDGGTTWVDQGTDQSPNNGSCGITITGTWNTTFTVASPSLLKFRVYGFNASSTTGTVQLMNLIINGTVSGGSTGCGLPSGLSATSITTTSATLNWAAVSGATSFDIQYRQVGTTSWSTTTSATTSANITGLTSGVTYEFQVQTVCSGSLTSGYSSSGTFTTAGGTVSGSSGKIAVYFNNPVNISVSTGVNAIYLNDAFADTIIAYINRAKYSIDIAQYDYNQSGSYSNIATAVNNAYAAGKKVRWIYDGSQPNTGIALLTAGIQTLASPTTSAYNIMHNKFIIIDANSTDPNDAIVSTGSEDWGVTQLNTDNNNLLFIQDSSLAHVYLNEFNMMWGDTGTAPNTTLSKFGPYKTDLGQHIFHIGGKLVELYFSPSDGTDNHIRSTIQSANTDLYFGVYDFTVAADADSIVARKNAGVYVAGIVDQYSNTGAAYPILTGALGSSMKTYVNSTLVYHNKMVLVDPSNACSDPTVLTGSHNWTTSANTKNDENTLIIHNDTIANIYYQAFYAEYAALGGSLTAIAPCTMATCGIPIGLYASSITSTSAVLNWTAVSGAVSYSIQYRQVGTTTWSTTISSSTSVTVSGLTAATDYEFQVSTTCASGSSAFSASGDFTTLSLPCTVPTGLDTISVSTTSASITWLTVSGAVSYTIQYRQIGTSTWSTASSPVNSYTISGLTPGISYECQVEVVCATGTSGFSGSLDFTTTTITCPIPAGLTASSISGSSEMLSWASATGAVSYTIQYRPTGTSGWTFTSSATTSVTVSGLTPGTTYEFQVQSVCSASDSSGYSISSLFTTAGIACNVPIGLGSASITDTSALLSWAAVTGALGYSIQYHVAGTSGWTYTTSSTTSISISGLTPATAYEFQVQAICSATDSSGYSISSFFTTSGGTVGTCPIPAGLTMSSFSGSTAVLTWAMMPGAVSYNIQYRGPGSGWVLVTSTTNSVTIPGLIPLTGYQFEVQSVCSGSIASDTSIYSFPVEFITQNTSAVLGATSLQSSFNIYPNPFTQNAEVSFTLTAAEKVNIAMYNMLGQEVTSLVKDELLEAGAHKTSLSIAAPGIYFVKLSTSHFSITKKVVKL